MNDTPRATRSRARASLSLNKHQNNSSPINTKSKSNVPIGSPVPCLSIEPNETTPTHRKVNLDDSNLDDSASSIDGSFSPTAFLSQTLNSNSPDVGWSWEKDFARDSPMPENIRKLVKTYFSENGNEDSPRTREERCEDYRKRYFAKRNERRRARDLQRHKAEKARKSALMKERFAKWEANKNSQSEQTTKSEEFMTISSNEDFNILRNTEDASTNSLESCRIEAKQNEFVKIRDNEDNFNCFEDFGDAFDDSIRIDDDITPLTPKNKTELKESLDDFFNDSDMDGLLIEATQKIESSQPKTEMEHDATQKFESNQSNPASKHESKTTKLSEVQINASKEKTSSHYMQCLEDDDDDFFVSLDDSWLQKVSQNVKPRSPFARYKSMPTTTTVTEIKSSSTITTKAGSSRNSNIPPKWSLKNGYSNSTSPSTSRHSIKRHASSHTISPSNSNYHGRQMHRRD